MRSGSWFADAFGAAVSDIRKKLIDEAFWGRHPAERASSPSSHDNERPAHGFAEPADQSHEIGIDR